MSLSVKQPLAVYTLVFYACLLQSGFRSCKAHASAASIKARGASGDAEFCACGVEQVEEYFTLGELVRRVYPGTSEDTYEVIEDSLVECNGWLRGGVEKGGQVVLPCLFPEEQELRPRLADPEVDCGCERTHEVMTGESIWSIARKVYPNLDPVMVSHMILGCNPGMSPRRVEEGQVLQMYCLDEDLKQMSVSETSLPGIRIDQRKLLKKEESNDTSKFFIEEGCPVCDVPLFTPSKKVNDKSLPVCGCDNECAQCAVNFVNGCTGPFADRIEGLFEDTVRPACFAHDVCYSCGNHFLKEPVEGKSYMRKQCDDIMLENMNNRCQTVYRKEARFLAACRLVASTYHKAARVFGGDFFIEKCACPDGWKPYVDNLFMMDFCASPVDPSFSLQRENEEMKGKKGKNGKKGN